MRKIFCLFLSISLTFICISQTIHKAIGGDDFNEVLYDSKIDPNNGGTVSVGFHKYDILSEGDAFIVKLDASKNILWQKSIFNNGDDVFYKVKICANGDYLVAGKISYYSNFQSTPKAVLCRINSTTGDIIWSCIPLQSTGLTDVFNDMIETSSGMIAVVGGLNNKSSYIVLLNSNGTYSTSIKSITNYNEFSSISELPNGDLIVSGYSNAGTNYHYATIVEFNSTTLNIISHKRYDINITIPGGPTVISLWPFSLSVKNNSVLLSCIPFRALNSAEAAGICVYNYDLTTKALTGSLYYQPGYSNATNYSFFPLTETDFLLSLTYTSPSLQISASRITNGTRVYDRKINGLVSSISSLYSYNGNLVCAGKIPKTLPSTKTNGYYLFSSINLPVASSLCNVTDINTQASMNSNLNATSNSSVLLLSAEQTIKIVLTMQNRNCTILDPCIPINLSSYTFTGNGYWSVAANWLNNSIPPAILTANSTITINPISGGACILDISQTISHGANLIINSGANFYVQGDINIDSTDVKICSQVWTSKNLDATTYRNGDIIPKVTDMSTWATMTIGAYCYYDNDSATYAGLFGKLYNWYAVNDPRGLAPNGWHIPSSSEWSALISCLGGFSVAGGPVKEVGLLHWLSPNTGATNSTGFTSLPSGYRTNAGSFLGYGGLAQYWSSSVFDSVEAFGASTSYNTEELTPTAYVKVAGFSVRCVKD